MTSPGSLDGTEYGAVTAYRVMGVHEAKTVVEGWLGDEFRSSQTWYQERADPMTADWLGIRYREFCDIPRAVVVEWYGSLYLFDSPFDVERDDYSNVYQVYRLPNQLRDTIDDISWTDLARRGVRIGSVPTRAVEFDQTRRQLMNPSAFQYVERDETPMP